MINKDYFAPSALTVYPNSVTEIYVLKQTDIQECLNNRRTDWLQRLNAFEKYLNYIQNNLEAVLLQIEKKHHKRWCTSDLDEFIKFLTEQLIDSSFKTPYVSRFKTQNIQKLYFALQQFVLKNPKKFTQTHIQLILSLCSLTGMEILNIEDRIFAMNTATTIPVKAHVARLYEFAIGTIDVYQNQEIEVIYQHSDLLTKIAALISHVSVKSVPKDITKLSTSLDKLVKKTLYDPVISTQAILLLKPMIDSKQNIALDFLDLLVDINLKIEQMQSTKLDAHAIAIFINSMNLIFTLESELGTTYFTPELKDPIVNCLLERLKVSETKITTEESEMLMVGLTPTEMQFQLTLHQNWIKTLVSVHLSTDNLDIIFNFLSRLITYQSANLNIKLRWDNDLAQLFLKWHQDRDSDQNKIINCIGALEFVGMLASSDLLISSNQDVFEPTIQWILNQLKQNPYWYLRDTLNQQGDFDYLYTDRKYFVDCYDKLIKVTSNLSQLQFIGQNLVGNLINRPFMNHLYHPTVEQMQVNQLPPYYPQVERLQVNQAPLLLTQAPGQIAAFLPNPTFPMTMLPAPMFPIPRFSPVILPQSSYNNPSQQHFGAYNPQLYPFPPFPMQHSNLPRPLPIITPAASFNGASPWLSNVQANNNAPALDYHPPVSQQKNDRTIPPCIYSDGYQQPLFSTVGRTPKEIGSVHQLQNWKKR